jgi:TonB family protein
LRIEPVVGVVLALSIVAVAADDPDALVEKAHRAHARRDDDKAIALLRKADAVWQDTGPSVSQHVEALELMALLMKSQASEEAEHRGAAPYGTDLEHWRNEAAPGVKHALAICDANNSCKPEDLALALELQADVLGRNQDGTAFWTRATKIRAERVAQLGSAPVPDQPSSEADSSAPEEIGKAVSQPVPIAKREPDYTEAARLMRYSGTALLSLIIDVRGIPTHIQLLRGLGYGLDEQAAIAVRTWRFRPAMKYRMPVAVKANIQVNFRLL